MTKNLEERLAELSAKLEELSKKAASASEDAKAARELRDEKIKDKLSTAKGDVEALKENIRIAGEQDRSKLGSALIKAQMTIEAKIQDRKDAKDKKRLEAYMDAQVNYIYDCFEAATYLIADGQLAILETLAAAAEYEERFAKEDEA